MKNIAMLGFLSHSVGLAKYYRINVIIIFPIYSCHVAEGIKSNTGQCVTYTNTFVLTKTKLDLAQCKEMCILVYFLVGRYNNREIAYDYMPLCSIFNCLHESIL